MIGNNSCGTHSLLGGKTVDNVEELRILLYDGSQMTVGATSGMELRSHHFSGGRPGEIYSKLRRIQGHYADLIRARFPQIPRRVSGYNLDELLLKEDSTSRARSSEQRYLCNRTGTKLKLIHSPQHRALVGLGIEMRSSQPIMFQNILQFRPIGLEGFEGSIMTGSREGSTD